MTDPIDSLQSAVEHGQDLSSYQQEKHELLRLLKRLYHDGSIGLYEGGGYVMDEDARRDLADHFIRHDYDFLVDYEGMIAERVKKGKTLDPIVPAMLHKAEGMATRQAEWEDLRRYVAGLEGESGSLKDDLGRALKDGV